MKPSLSQTRRCPAGGCRRERRARHRRRCPGADPGLADQAGHRRRAVRGRRWHRHRHPHRGPAAGAALGPAGQRRQPRRRRRQPGTGHGVARPSRRLHAAGRQRRHAVDQPDAVQEAQLQPRHRVRADRPVRRAAVPAGGDDLAAGQQRARTGGAGEGQSRRSTPTPVPATAARRTCRARPSRSPPAPSCCTSRTRAAARR